jgi:hypothetical protein
VLASTFCPRMLETNSEFLISIKSTQNHRYTLSFLQALLSINSNNIKTFPTQFTPSTTHLQLPKSGQRVYPIPPPFNLTQPSLLEQYLPLCTILPINSSVVIHSSHSVSRPFIGVFFGKYFCFVR